MRIAVLTSSRADYGIYLPLLKRLKGLLSFELIIIAFGTHLSKKHGYTIEQIEKDGFEVSEKVDTAPSSDSKESISLAMGDTSVKFSKIWGKWEDRIDLVLALGDRYEMFAAVSAVTPFNIEVAHIHGGETTLGAIDNKLRHAITALSSLHFTATAAYSDRVKSIISSDKGVYNVGALSLDNLIDMQLLNKVEFQKTFNIDLRKPSILVTFHPETVRIEKNREYTETLKQTFESLSLTYQIIITMPNADTMGNFIREQFQELAKNNSTIIAVENFGTLGYFSCMKHCTFMLGNTSSGIIEAASFGKYVLNLGDRQKGRARSNNVVDLNVSKEIILENVKHLEQTSFTFKGQNIYRKENSANLIIEVLKSYER